MTPLKPVNRLETTKGSPTEGRPAQNAGGGGVCAFADTVKVSNAASSKAHQQLAEAPPIDTERLAGLLMPSRRGDSR